MTSSSEFEFGTAPVLPQVAALAFILSSELSSCQRDLFLLPRFGALDCLFSDVLRCCLRFRQQYPMVMVSRVDRTAVVANVMPTMMTSSAAPREHPVGLCPNVLLFLSPSRPLSFFPSSLVPRESGVVVVVVVVMSSATF